MKKFILPLTLCLLFSCNDAKVLSDSGIDRLGGNSNDPAVKAAALKN